MMKRYNDWKKVAKMMRIVLSTTFLASWYFLSIEYKKVRYQKYTPNLLYKSFKKTIFVRAIL